MKALLVLVTFVAFMASVSAEEGKAPIRVALYDDAGSTGKGVPRVTELLGKDTSFKLTVLKGADIASGALKDHDVVIFTGGSGSKQAAGLGEAGKVEVRKFVENGGGYVGICAGAYLACSGFDWSLGVLDAMTVSNKWKRGIGDVKIQVHDIAPAVTGITTGEQSVRYANGPIIKPAGRDDIPDYETLASFRTELAENNSPKGIMVDSPAWARGIFGKGRVIVSSPHPEQTPGMDAFVASAVKWAAGK
ncbi:biotin protein ligase-like protein [Roseimicrobium gellanilyticum]|uniref:Biotin protein ligase-like protein n=1 Tax=Roseimicrobium gellanilyticum TaxID=748857 RepID=A0A366HP54_9BACT|nr:BPL-N domain-containing protein [Roseimicrobium gellanilyticum]RBP45275.1 biotin protein ligase-like protein [Roseimicrobium gellanilyticum]